MIFAQAATLDGAHGKATAGARHGLGRGLQALQADGWGGVVGPHHDAAVHQHQLHGPNGPGGS